MLIRKVKKTLFSSLPTKQTAIALNLWSNRNIIIKRDGGSELNMADDCMQIGVHSDFSLKICLLMHFQAFRALRSDV